jgi:ribosome maturation factor RimP
MANKSKIEHLIQPIIEALGFELWGCELHTSGRHTVLRVYIEVPATSESKSVTIDDCSRVSNQLSAFLDVEDPIAGQYSLEVSSPGTDRLLFKLEHYKKYIGSVVHVTLHADGVAGRRNYTGQINEVNADTINLMVDNEILAISFATIAKAKLLR